MHECLERLETELVAILDELNARETQLAPRARPEKWTIQQSVEHLLLTYRSTSAQARLRLHKGAPTRAQPSLGQRLAQMTVLNLGYFPSGRHAPPAVCPTLPASLRTGAELTRRLHEDLLEMDGALAQAETVFGQRRFASHLILGPLSAKQWRKFHLVHGRHHANQIRRIRREHEGRV